MELVGEDNLGSNSPLIGNGIPVVSKIRRLEIRKSRLPEVEKLFVEKVLQPAHDKTDLTKIDAAKFNQNALFLGYRTGS